MQFAKAIAIVGLCGISLACSRSSTSRPEAAEKSSKIVPIRNCDFSQTSAIRMADWLSHGGLLQRFEAVYPPAALRDHIQGRISVHLLINEKGDVAQFCGSGPTPLREAAEEAAVKCRFRVPELNGKKIPLIEDSLVYDFVLDESRRNP